MKILFLLSFLLIFTSGFSQINKDDQKEIDNLFVDWNKPNHPGGTIAIMYDGEIQFLKSYGLASLEFLVPNTKSTIYNCASVSKQFSAMAMVILHLEGKIDINEDVRTYLPWVPDFGEEIRISHLLHHTSGLRSLHALLGLAGWRGDDGRTNEDINRFLIRQKELNVPRRSCEGVYSTPYTSSCWIRQHALESRGAFSWIA